jgi:hypothetical protein
MGRAYFATVAPPMLEIIADPFLPSFSGRCFSIEQLTISTTWS